MTDEPSHFIRLTFPQTQKAYEILSAGDAEAQALADEILEQNNRTPNYFLVNGALDMLDGVLVTAWFAKLELQGATLKDSREPFMAMHMVLRAALGRSTELSPELRELFESEAFR